MKFFEMLFEKLRINVIILAFLVAFLTLEFAQMLTPKIPDLLSAEILALLIGVGIGGLLTAMMQMFSGPSVPSDAHERMMIKLIDRIDEKE
jgi:hypothetical protein